MSAKETFSAKDLQDACEQHQLENIILNSTDENSLYELLKEALKDYNKYIPKKLLKGLKNRIEKEQCKANNKVSTPKNCDAEKNSTDPNSTSDSKKENNTDINSPQEVNSTESQDNLDDNIENTESLQEKSSPETPTDTNEKITSNSSKTYDSPKINSEAARNFENMYKDGINLSEQVNTLNENLLHLDSKITSLFNVNGSTDLNNYLPSINEILSSNSSCVSIQVNKELINKLAKYVDNHKLLHFEHILRNNVDLPSVIVQIVLFKFIIDKNL